MAVDDARVALVGHCGPDAYALRSALRSLFPKGEIAMVNGEGALTAEIARADLLLVNRLLDGQFQQESGAEVIRALAARPPDQRPSLMLISNFPEAQAEAQAAGAMPGFGKRQMYSAEARERILAAVAARRAVGR
jgi:two-component system, chemotaxis family, chemotaxis protein CheY